MKIPEQVDVLIVGAGPVGLTAANLLARYGVRTLLIERFQTTLDIPRAIALDNEALRILQWAGLTDDAFERKGITQVDINSSLFGTISSITTAGTIDCHPKLVTIYQPSVERALESNLAGAGHFSIARGIELTRFTQTDTCVLAHLQAENGEQSEVRCQYMIGADGANSMIRKSLGLDFDGGRQYREAWLIVDLKNVSGCTKSEPVSGVEMNCDLSRPCPRMSAPGDRERYEFKLKAGEDAETMTQEAVIRELLSPWYPNRDAEIERKAIYQFQARTAPSFQRGRVLLMGDAAHLTPPFAGQGLVAGLRDAANLCWKLSLALKTRQASSLINSYDQERRPHARAVVNLAVLFGYIMMPKSRIRAAVIHGLVWLLRFIPGLKGTVTELEIKPKNRFAKGWFHTKTTQSKIRHGALFPQTWLVKPEGQHIRCDDVYAGHFRIITSGFLGEPDVEPGLLQRWQAIDGKFLAIGHPSQGLKDVTGEACWEDQTGAVFPGTMPANWVVILRPDQVVMCAGPRSEINRLLDDSLTLITGSSEGQSRHAA